MSLLNADNNTKCLVCDSQLYLSIEAIKRLGSKVQPDFCSKCYIDSVVCIIQSVFHDIGKYDTEEKIRRILGL